MPKRLTYKFTIGAFNPDTIPMSRLSEYMPDLASLLGEPSSVHFSNLETGSTVLSVTVGTEAIPKVSERIAQVSSGYIPDEIKKHFDGLDMRLAADNATGSPTPVWRWPTSTPGSGYRHRRLLPGQTSARSENPRHAGKAITRPMDDDCLIHDRQHTRAVAKAQGIRFVSWDCLQSQMGRDLGYRKNRLPNKSFASTYPRYRINHYSS